MDYTNGIMYFDELFTVKQPVKINKEARRFEAKENIANFRLASGQDDELIARFKLDLGEICKKVK